METKDRKKIDEQLQLFRNLIDQSNDAIFVTDPQTSYFLDINEKACSSLGYTREELLKMGAVDIEVVLPDKFLWQEHVRDVKKQGFMILEGVHKRKDGTTFSVEVNVKHLTLEKKDYMVAIARDITELKKMQNEMQRLNQELEKRVIERTAQLEIANRRLNDKIAALKLAEEKILKEKNFTRAVIDSLPVTFFIFDLTGKMLQWNKTAESVTGYSPDEIARMGPLDFIAEEDRGLVQKRIEEVFIKGRAGVEANYLTKAGEKIPYYFTGVRIMMDNVPGLVGIGIDISDRKRTDEALKKSEAHYRGLVETSPYSIILTDLDGKITFSNHQTLKMHGFKDVKDILGTSCFDLFAPKSRQRAIDMAKQTFKNGGFKNVEYNLIRQDGSQFPAEASASLIVDKDGKPEGFVGVLWDITGRKEMEKELRKIHLLESIGVLAGGIAHDFNNLLTAIMGNIYLAKMYLSKITPTPDSKIFKVLTNSEESCNHAKELSSMLITFAKGGEPIKETVLISKMVKEQANLLLGSTNIDCEYEFPENLYPVKVDKMQIKQVIRGLVANAIESMDGEGVIRITAENVSIKDDPILKDGNYLKISVTDNGIGIAEENINKIFDPYFSTKEMGSQKGMGLGLSICHSIIKRHDGQIKVESKTGVGTTFHIYLPAS